jgi:hypothetical protein
MARNWFDTVTQSGEFIHNFPFTNAASNSWHERLKSSFTTLLLLSIFLQLNHSSHSGGGNPKDWQELLCSSCMAFQTYNMDDAQCDQIKQRNKGKKGRAIASP